MSEPHNYATATGPLLPSRDALRAVLEYAEDFITRGDSDVMRTLSGGAILVDGSSADPAIWGDWIEAWDRAASQPEGPKPGGPGEEPILLSMQHAYRAFLVLLERYYQPADQTRMSAVRDDCLGALGGEARGEQVWENWLQAGDSGATADIAFSLEPSGNG